MVNALYSILALASAVAAQGTPVPPGHAFQAPGAGDVRGPCPGLNTLANHNFLPHSGMNITIPLLVAAGKSGLNVGSDFMTTIGKLGLKANPAKGADFFNLDQLDQHNFPIEHDASLSRQDHYFGDWFDFNQDAFDQFLAVYGDAETTSIASTAAAKYARVSDSLKRDPQVTYGPKQFLITYTETALMLQVLSRSTTSGAAELSYVKYFFTNQELPYALGWSPGPNEITLKTLGSMVLKLVAAKRVPKPNGLGRLNVDSLKNLLAKLDAE